jgi:hypothetical protein
MTYYAGTMVGTTAPALKELGIAESWLAEATWLPVAQRYVRGTPWPMKGLALGQGAKGKKCVSRKKWLLV